MVQVTINVVDWTVTVFVVFGFPCVAVHDDSVHVTISVLVVFSLDVIFAGAVVDAGVEMESKEDKIVGVATEIDGSIEVDWKHVWAGLSTTIKVALMYLPSLLTVPILMVYVADLQLKASSVVIKISHEAAGV